MRRCSRNSRLEKEGGAMARRLEEKKASGCVHGSVAVSFDERL